jgi:P-type E1-E2 ATPase
MSVAVVFDSAGTLLNTYRVAKDICNKKLLPGIETTTLTFSSPDRVLVVLPVQSKVMINTDKTARVGDLQECIRNVWTVCKAESIVTLNSGAIINMALGAIEFTITAGGWPFDGAKETISALHRMGVPTFIASGDRVTKLEKMADHLGIPRDRVYGIATPTVKAQIVSDLRQEYDKVLMVGDGINDLCAMRTADIAILTIQQAGDRPEELYAAADHVVKDVSAVLPIVQELLTSHKHSG